MKETPETLAALGEFSVIREFFAPLHLPAAPGVITGIGDDAAVLAVPRTQQLLATVDAMVEGIHFASGDDPFLVGQKALRVNLSDIAAMGGQPRWYLLSLGLPGETPTAWLAEFVRGLRVAGEDFGVQIVGGNTTGSTSGKSIHLTLFGLVGQGRALSRAGAVVGDRILVSGTIGDAALGLAVRQGRMRCDSTEDRSYLEGRLDLPQPRIALGLAVSDAAAVHAMIDVSDGLVADLGHLCQASGVGARVDVEKMPLSDAARRLVTQDPSRLALLLTGGEDYELIVTAAEGALEMVMTLARQVGVALTDIGEITASGAVEMMDQGAPIVLEQSGWRHF
ncbi:MAG: thiamine-phosphate kinase [Magnetococcales bacterium]|nr:thiamine-phosphate kinase [Magnetococcales bacterium]